MKGARTMTDQVETDAVRRSVRGTGLIAAAWGLPLMVLGFGFTGITVYLAHPFAGGGWLFPSDFSMRYLLVLMAVLGVLGALLAIAGLGLARGREWARRMLVVAVCLIMPWFPAMVFVNFQGEVRTLPLAAAFLHVGLLGVAIWWLRRPTIRAGCR
jgi:hypothetical protein